MVSLRILVKISIWALALTLASSANLQASLLYPFGPDPDSDPSEFTSINPQNSTAVSLYDMADATDSFGFNGGVTYRPANGLLYTIINDSSGNSSLISFPLGGGGAFTNLQSIGVGFFGGLTFDTVRVVPHTLLRGGLTMAQDAEIGKRPGRI